MSQQYKPRRRPRRYRYIHLGVSKFEDYKVDGESGKAKWHYFDGFNDVPGVNTHIMLSSSHEFENFNALKKSQIIPVSRYLLKYKPMKKDQ